MRLRVFQTVGVPCLGGGTCSKNYEVLGGCIKGTPISRNSNIVVCSDCSLESWIAEHLAFMKYVTGTFIFLMPT